MNKIIWIVCILVFVFVTSFVLSLENNTASKRVKITNQNFEITHENTQVVNSDSVKLNFDKSNIENKDVTTSNKKIGLSSSGINNSDINFKNSGGIDKQNTDFQNESALARQSTNFNNPNSSKYQKINYKNLDNSSLDAILADAENHTAHTTKLKSEPINRQEDKYVYKELDWNTWHSNFVNKILDDSMAIHELDRYGEGTWFYYSFKVHKNGSISDISVKSIYLRAEDREKVANLIKSYQYKGITIFPQNSKRETAKVSAVMMLSNTSQHAKPNDFNDSERVKIKL